MGARERVFHGPVLVEDDKLDRHGVEYRDDVLTGESVRGDVDDFLIPDDLTDQIAQPTPFADFLGNELLIP